MKKPTVTELTGLLNKPALISWSNKLGLNGQTVKAYQKSVFNDGNKKHEEIENYLIHGVYIEDDEKRNKIDEIFKGVEIISIEESFENDYYKGRCDIRFIKDGITYVGDFKRKFKRAYNEHYIQLFCYKMHFNSEKICIIDLENFEIHELNLYKEELYKELINNLINIYNIKQKL